LLKQLSAFYFHHCVVAKPVPELETNFEQLIFSDIAKLDHILQTLLDRAAHYLDILIWLHRVCYLLNQGDVVF